MSIKSWILTKIYYRKHPEAALRYLPIIDLLKKSKLLNSSILEIGSGSYGITPYLKREIVGVDTSFSEPEYPLLKQVKGSAIKLPFEDSKFEVVVLSDVLEHLPVNIRKKCLDESIRVAKKLVIVSGPFGKEAAAQDKKLADYSVKKIGSMHHFFADHLKYGLPEVSEIEGYIAGSDKVKNFKIVSEYLNLQVREWLMKFFITKERLGYYFYLKGLMPIVPILTRLNSKPCYRTLISISLK